MLPAYKLKGSVAVSICVAASAANVILDIQYRETVPTPLVAFLLVISTSSGFYTYWAFTKAKGYSAVLGIVLACFTVVGFIVLLMLPDKHPQPKIPKVA
jgi:hypothetical protein